MGLYIGFCRIIGFRDPARTLHGHIVPRAEISRFLGLRG